MPRLRLTHLGRSHPFLAALVSAGLLWIAGEPIAAWPVALIALVPLFWAIVGARPRRAGAAGFLFGFAYFGLHMYWILLFGKPAWLALTAANAAYLAVFAAGVPVLWRVRHPVRSIAIIAAWWTALEFLRGSWPLGGLTWGALMYTQAGNPVLLPAASVVGGWGISFFVVLINGLVLVAVARRRWFPALLAAVVLTAPTLIPEPPEAGPVIDVAAIQVGAPESAHPIAANRETAGKFAAAHERLAGRPPDLVVWPENAFDDDPTFDPLYGATGTMTYYRRLLTTAVARSKVPTVVGAITGPLTGKQRNELLAVAPNGRIVDRVAKVHLVPFGEYAPFRDLLASVVKEMRWIRRDLTPGREVDPLQVGELTVGAMICYENAFPSLQRALVRKGADFVLVSTNNASYRETAASAQHLAISRLRAVESGRWVVHAGLTGTSAFIDPTGKVFHETMLFEPEIIRQNVSRGVGLTPYMRFGDWLPWLSWGIALAGFAIPRGRRARPAEPAGRQTEPAGEPPPKRPRTLVVLPTYNEAATIGEVLSRLLELPEGVDVLVVDDASPDGTAAIVEKVAGAGAPVSLVRRAAKAGLASAYVTGFEVGIRDGYDLIVEMDSDLSHQPEELPALLHGATDHDLVIGSRYVPGGSVTNWSKLRRLLSRAGNVYAQRALGIPVRDATSGFRVYRRRVLAELMAQGIHADGYGFQIELAYRAWQSGNRVGEVPITFREREHGHSKISRRIVFEALWLVTVWGLRDRLRPEPLTDTAAPTWTPT